MQVSPPHKQQQNDKSLVMITNFESEQQESMSAGNSIMPRVEDDITGNATLDIGVLKKRERQILSTSPLPQSESSTCALFANCEDCDRKSKAIAATVSIDSAEDLRQGQVCEKKIHLNAGLDKKNCTTGDLSNIYGASSGGGISFLGSWALRTCKEEGIMPSPGGLDTLSRGNDYSHQRQSVHPGGSVGTNEQKPSSSRDGSAGNSSRQWYFEAGTSFDFRVHHLLKIFALLMIVIIVLSFVFHTRIRNLENDRVILIHELAQMRMHLDRAVEKMDAIASEAIPLRSERIYLDTETDAEENTGYEKERTLVKRSASAEPSRTTKELQYSPATISYNTLNNGSAPFNSDLDDWTTDITQSKPLKEEARAAYLELDGFSLNIKKSKQLIGPWYLPDTGKDIRFNGKWYDNLKLDDNGTSVIFQEDGLFLIYAQIFYQQQPVHNVKPSPMGFRIHLRKRNGSGGRPVTRTIAECVPSYPATYYQTCFTQVAWFVESEDEIFLEHFTDSRPMIEAVKNGQTFLGIVRLSN